MGWIAIVCDGMARRDEPYRRAEKDFDGRVRRVDRYQPAQTITTQPNPNQPNLPIWQPIGRRDEPYHRTKKVFDGSVRRFDRYQV